MCCHHNAGQNDNLMIEHVVKFSHLGNLVTKLAFMMKLRADLNSRNACYRSADS
jgi:hypothetical protein